MCKALFCSVPAPFSFLSLTALYYTALHCTALRDRNSYPSWRLSFCKVLETGAEAEAEAETETETGAHWRPVA